jgi:uncharacterized protein
MPAVITAFALAPYAAILGLMFIWLSMRVALMRSKLRKQPDSVDPALFDRCGRVQANFAEYVPFALLLIWLTALTQTHFLTINGLACLLVFSRIAHAYGLLVQEPTKQRYSARALSVLAVMLVFLSCSVILLLHWINAVTHSPM